MKLLRTFLPLVCLCLFATPCLRAQVSVYGTFGAADYGFSDKNTGHLTIYSDTVAFEGGAMYRFSSQARNQIGVDVRFQGSPGGRGGEAGVIALQYAFVPREHRLSPYVQVGVGFVSDTGNEPTVPYSNEAYLYERQRVTSPAVGFAGGLDLRLSPSWDYRIIDLQDYAGVSGAPIAGSAAFSTGVVYHFGKRS